MSENVFASVVAVFFDLANKLANTVLLCPGLVTYKGFSPNAGNPKFANSLPLLSMIVSRLSYMRYLSHER